MKNDEFHKPFVKSLLLIIIVTMFAMVLSDKLINYYSSLSYKTTVFASENSYNETNTKE